MDAVAKRLNLYRGGALLFVVALLALWGGLGNSPSPPPATQTPSSDKLSVVATTTLVGDVVRQVAGDRADVSVLLPPNVDAHTFEPAPRDLVAVATADVVFVNGFQLEGPLLTALERVGEHTALTSVSRGIVPRALGKGESGDRTSIDPHVWLDPNNVIVWVDNIARALSQVDPEHAPDYRTNAARYDSKLRALDAWIEDQVAHIPPRDRLLVTNHDAFGYLAQRYGFRLIGSVLPGLSTLAEPSAKNLATLIDAIKKLGVKAIFVGTTVNPTLARRLAEDTGVTLVSVYTASLGAPGGPAATYLDYMRFDVAAIVGALEP